mmetsp:Transcript_25829/g.43925  ORF Transcript_25829/g.43925 Transcript_25829/m.43925 type:complete len:175 (-) Transcript_25829:1483-2007(-)
MVKARGAFYLSLLATFSQAFGESNFSPKTNLRGLEDKNRLRVNETSTSDAPTLSNPCSSIVKSEEERFQSCQNNLLVAESRGQSGRWGVADYVSFVRLHFSPFEGFSHLPLPLIAVFHEYACQCEHEENCCLGPRAYIQAPPNGEQETDWFRTLCHRVNIVIDHLCENNNNDEF